MTTPGWSAAVGRSSATEAKASLRAALVRGVTARDTPSDARVSASPKPKTGRIRRSGEIPLLSRNRSSPSAVIRPSMARAEISSAKGIV